MPRTCPECHKPIAEGDQAVRVSGQSLHSACWERYKRENLIDDTEYHDTDFPCGY